MTGDGIRILMGAPRKFSNGGRGREWSEQWVGVSPSQSIRGSAERRNIVLLMSESLSRQLRVYCSFVQTVQINEADLS